MKLNSALSGLLILPALLTSMGCGSDEAPTTTTYTLDAAEYSVVTDGGLTHGSTSVSGAGSIVFATSLGSTESKKDVELLFTLEDTGSLTLVSNSGADLTGGMSVRFTRSGSTLQAALVFGATETDISSAFTGVDASGELQFFVDLHNDEDPAHILVWGTASEFTEDSALLNSENEGNATPGKGTGSSWGLTLSKATVNTAALSDPKFTE